MEAGGSQPMTSNMRETLRGVQIDWHCGLVDRVSARRGDRWRLANDISGCSREVRLFGDTGKELSSRLEPGDCNGPFSRRTLGILASGAAPRSRDKSDP